MQKRSWNKYKHRKPLSGTQTIRLCSLLIQVASRPSRVSQVYRWCFLVRVFEYTATAYFVA